MGLEPQFVMNIALATVALGHEKLFAPASSSGPEKAMENPLAQVVVTGTNLKTGVGHPVAKVGTIVAVVDDSSLTSVTFTIPPAALTGRISLVTADGTAVSVVPLVVTP